MCLVISEGSTTVFSSVDSELMEEAKYQGWGKSIEEMEAARFISNRKQREENPGSVVEYYFN